MIETLVHRNKQKKSKKHSLPTYNVGMLHPQRLLVLRAVLTAGSVSAAARNLNYAPATISQHLAALARETGLVLFERDGRGITPTAAALSLADDAEAVLASLDRIGRTIEDLRSTPAEHLAIACFSSAAQVWLPDVVRELRGRYPELRVEISLNEPHDGQGRHLPDLDIRNEPDPGPETRLVGYLRHPLVSEDFYAVLPPAHPLATHETIPLVDLREESWIDHDIYDSPTGQAIATATRAAGFTPKWAARLDDHHAALALVEAGIGIMVLPRLAFTSMPEGLVPVPVTRPSIRRRIVVHTALAPRRNALVTEALSALFQVIARPERSISEETRS